MFKRELQILFVCVKEKKKEAKYDLQMIKKKLLNGIKLVSGQVKAKRTGRCQSSATTKQAGKKPA